MRAFILRRLELIARDLGDVVVIGSMHCAGTLRVKEFLTRNGHPFHYIDLDRDADAQELLDRFHVSAADVPVLICRGDAVLRNPEQSADRRLPRVQRGDRSDARAATWSSSARGRPDSRPRSTARPKGSTSSSLESNAPGGQAGSSSRIENYLGFPDRHLRAGADRPRLRAGAEVRRAHHGRERRDVADLRRAAVRACRSTAGPRCRRAR